MKRPKPPPERAMGEAELDRWLRARRARGALATSLPKLDGFVTAMAAGPMGQDLIGLICDALALERSAFDVGGTPEFAAIKATADRFNALGQRLADGDLAPLHRKKPNGEVDASEWCEGFLAAANLAPAAWKAVLEPTSPLYGLMLPILAHCKTSTGEPWLGPPRPGAATQRFLKQAYTEIPMSVAAIYQHYHFTPTPAPRPRAPYR